ncbi:hypothetical protein ANCCAN_26508, partial [Ancylostoma caninum]
MIIKITMFSLVFAAAHAFLAWSPDAAGPRGSLPTMQEVPLRIGSDFDYLMLTRIYPTAVCRA